MGNISEKAVMCRRLSDFVCEDLELYTSMEEALQLLEEQAEKDGSVMADHVVTMWEKVEYEFTVDELLKEIKN